MTCHAIRLDDLQLQNVKVKYSHQLALISIRQSAPKKKKKKKCANKKTERGRKRKMPTLRGNFPNNQAESCGVSANDEADATRDDAA